MKQTYSSSSYKVAAVPHLTLVGSLSLCVCWLVGYFLLPDHLLSQLVGFLFHLLIGYCLILLNNTYAIIRVHASLQTFIYLLLVAVCPFLHEFQLTDVAMLLLLFSVYFIFGSYQQANSVYPFFMSFLFLGIGTLFVPKMVFLSPLWWLGAYYFRSLSLRGWFASLLGWIVPIWLLFVYEYVFGNLTILRRIFAEIVTLFPIDRTMHVRLFDSEMAVWIYALFLFLVCISYAAAYGYKNAIRTRVYLSFFLILSFCLLAFLLLQPAYGREMFAWLFFGVSIPIGNLLTQGSGRSTRIVVWIAVAGLIALFGFNVWTLWSNF